MENSWGLIIRTCHTGISNEKKARHPKRDRRAFRISGSPATGRAPGERSCSLGCSSLRRWGDRISEARRSQPVYSTCAQPVVSFICSLLHLITFSLATLHSITQSRDHLITRSLAPSDHCALSSVHLCDKSHWPSGVLNHIGAKNAHFSSVIRTIQRTNPFFLFRASNVTHLTVLCKRTATTPSVTDQMNAP